MQDGSMPMRGFPETEYVDRLTRAQSMMADKGLAGLLLTTEPEVRYFTGYLTRFWESPSRPWFLVIPASGKPVAVIPAIGQELMSATWITDIRTWIAPDMSDDGVGLLADTLREIVPAGEIVGLPSGIETHCRMPLESLADLQTRIGDRKLQGDRDIIQRLRIVKSELEIKKISKACAIAAVAFENVEKIVKPGSSMAEVFRRFQIECLTSGADWVPYLAGGRGPLGYGDVISPASEEVLSEGDVLMLDTGLMWDGYFCDFDRNFAIGQAGDEVKGAYSRLFDATQAGLEAVRPGALAEDVYHAMNRVLTGGAPHDGRFGHGLGMQLTEWPSLIPGDKTVLEEGMVLTLEPYVSVKEGKILVQEENVVVCRDGCRFLTERVGPALPILKV